MLAIGAHKLALIALSLGACLLVGVAAAARLDERVFDRRPSVTNARVQVREVSQALEHWQSDNEAHCPPRLATLYDEHYLSGGPRDPWGHPLHFICPGAHAPEGADVSSAGADGVFGTSDDLVSWEP